MIVSAEEQEIAACVNILQPDVMAYERWVGAMESGGYRFGYGLLRTGEDKFDPFGVLAAITDMPWTWDDQEDAWACVGSAMFLRVTDVIRMLGIAEASIGSVEVIHATVEDFCDAVRRVADGASDFQPVITLLRAALQRSTEERRRYNERRSEIDRHSAPRYIGDGRDLGESIDLVPAHYYRR